jgi:hypothetical protein
MIQGDKLRAFAMGQAVSVRTDYTAREVRRFAKHAKDAARGRGDAKIHRLCDPTRVLDQDGCTVAETTPSIAADHFRGGSQNRSTAARLP